LSASAPSPDGDRQAAFLALSDGLRPELHRYCARIMGSVVDGEDVVQDTFIRALAALRDLDRVPPIRPWLFRIAHNRALDLLRSRAVRSAEPIEAAEGVADTANPDPEEMLMRQEAVNPQALIYLNRLSDLLFVLARGCNRQGQEDVLWVPGKTVQK